MKLNKIINNFNVMNKLSYFKNFSIGNISNLSNIIYIIGGIILFILFILFIIYVYFMMKTVQAISILQKNTNLITDNVNITTDALKIKGPVYKYAFTLNIYVNSYNFSYDYPIFSKSSVLSINDSNTVSSIIKLNDKEIVNTTPLNNEFTIGLLKNSPVMYLSSNESNNMVNNDSYIIITNNMPIQKWIHLTVSVDNNNIDIYIDGKLIKSYISKPNMYVLNKINDIRFGKGDVIISDFKYINDSIDPYAVQNIYKNVKK